MANKQAICDGCHRYTIAHASVCEACDKDYREAVQLYERIVQKFPEMRRMTLPQVMLRLATTYATVKAAIA